MEVKETGASGSYKEKSIFYPNHNILCPRGRKKGRSWKC